MTLPLRVSQILAAAGLTILVLGCQSTSEPSSESDSPLPVTDMAVKFEGSTFLHVTWTTPGTSLGNRLDTYDIRYSEDPIWSSAKRVPEVPPMLNPSEVQELYIFNLEPNTRYFVAARAIDSSRAWSDSLTWTSAHTDTTNSKRELFPTTNGLSLRYLRDSGEQLWRFTTTDNSSLLSWGTPTEITVNLDLVEDRAYVVRCNYYLDDPFCNFATAYIPGVLLWSDSLLDGVQVDFRTRIFFARLWHPLRKHPSRHITFWNWF